MHLSLNKLIVEHWMVNHPKLESAVAVSAGRLDVGSVPALAVKVWGPLAMAILHRRAHHVVTATEKSNIERKRRSRIATVRDIDMDTSFSAFKPGPQPDARVAERIASGTTAENLRTATRVIREWMPQFQFDSQRSEAEAVIRFLDDHGRRLRMTAVDESLDCTSYTHSSVDLIKLLLISTNVTSNHRLPVIIERVLGYVLPGYTLDMLREQMERLKVASPSTISRMQRVLDCAYCLHWRRRWSELHASNTTSIYLMADSSPQFKQDWFLQIVRICTDIRLVNNARMDIIAMHCTGLPDWSADEWRDWVLDLGPNELSCLRAYTATLRRHCISHTLIPTATGSKRGSSLHKLHNMVHALFMDHGTWEGVGRFLDSVVAFVSDQGTERLLAQVPFTLEELRRTSWTPQLSDVTGEVSAGIGDLFDDAPAAAGTPRLTEPTVPPPPPTPGRVVRSDEEGVGGGDGNSGSEDDFVKASSGAVDIVADEPAAKRFAAAAAEE